MFGRLANSASVHEARPSGCNGEAVGMEELGRVELLTYLLEEDEEEEVEDADLEGVFRGRHGEGGKGG